MALQGHRGRIRPLPEVLACPVCGSGLTEPVDIDVIGDGACRVERRCPECEWSGSDVYSAQAVARFRAELAAGRASLEALLDRVRRNRTAGELEQDL
jgi:hypothetical protein